MEVKSVDQILKEIKKKEYKQIYFLDGEEAFFIDQISSLIEKSVLSESEQSFNQLVLYGKDTDCRTIINTARRFPMMSQYQVVIVKEAQQLRNIDEMISYFSQPNPSTILVFCYKYKTLDKRKKLAKTLKGENCIFFTSKSLYENKVPAWIKSFAKSEKIEIEEDAIQILAEYLGTNLGKISNELDKIKLNVPAGEKISSKHIEEFIGISREYNFYELQKAMAVNDKAKAYRIVHYFGENPKAAPVPALIGSLYNFFNSLFLFHQYSKSGERELMKILGINNSYRFNEVKSAARLFPRKKTIRNLGLLLQFDMKSKGVERATSSDGELIKEMTFQLMN